MLINRYIQKNIECKLFKGKAILLYGPRQVGKTTIVHMIEKSADCKTMYMNGDEADVRQLLQNTTSSRLKSIFGDSRLVIIDEAQRIPDIGLTLKLITDQLKDIQVIATVSSAFELMSNTAEPLTGRKYEFHLFPFSFAEMVTNQGLLEERRMLADRLVFGYYPEIITNPNERTDLLKLLAGSYLYKDLLILDDVKKPSLLEKIIRALALQVGSEISISEISRLVAADRRIVERYIDLLEKTYVIFTLPAYSRNLRTEIRKGKKIYFYDNGIRNAVIGNLSHIESRTDVGALWENFLISERWKRNNYAGSSTKSYFWRTTQQQEVDYIEESTDGLKAWEFKWNVKKKARIPKTFLTNYPHATTGTVTNENFDEFLQK